MKRTLSKRAAKVWDGLKRLGFSSLWLAAAQTLSWLVCFMAVNGLYRNNQRLDWLVYGVGVLLPVLWGVGGYWLLGQYRPRGRGQNVVFLSLWTLLPAVLCWWAGRDGPDVLWLVLYPQMMARLAWFYPLFDGDQAANVLNVLQPLAAAGTHVLLMAGFAFGLWISGQRKKKGRI